MNNNQLKLLAGISLGVPILLGAQAATAQRSVVNLPGTSSITESRLIGASPEIKQRIAELQTTGQNQGWTFTVGYTEAMDVPLAQLAGMKAPVDFDAMQARQLPITEQLLKTERDELALQLPQSGNRRMMAAVTCTATSSVCDYTTLMTPVRNQGNCGSCSIFSAMGAWEGTYSKKFTSKFDTSEQHILSCSGGVTCANGGFWDTTFNWMTTNAVRAETQHPYTAAQGTCVPGGAAGTYRVSAWGYVAGMTNANNYIPPIANIKQALVTHGALPSGINATSAFQAYTSGVFNQNANSSGINHGVVIVGWDDTKQAWRVRNSWGSTSWGESGYAWVAYGSNRIGAYATWVSPKKLNLIGPGVPVGPLDSLPKQKG